jgi:hypothetical protein
VSRSRRRFFLEPSRAFVWRAHPVARSKYGEQANTPEVGWTPVGHSTERVELFERKIPKLEATALTLMKAVGEVEGATPQDILEFTLEGDLNKRKEFDPDISLLEVLKGEARH